MEEPWGTCVTGAVPIKECVQRCNKRQAELACGCRDTFENLNQQLDLIHFRITANLLKHMVSPICITNVVSMRIVLQKI